MDAKTKEVHDQLQSPLFSLPAELREQIFNLSLIADRRILNAVTELLVPASEKDIPPLGLGLRRTCRRIHAELDLDFFYHVNDFSFTRPMLASWFFSHLTQKQHKSIRALIIDLSHLDHEVGDEDPAANVTAGRQWIHYIGCTPTMHDSSRGCMYRPETLAKDLPHIETLTLDIVRLQDLADEAPDVVFDRQRIDRLLQNLIVEVWDGYENSDWLPGLRDIVLVGRVNSGRIVRRSIFDDVKSPSSKPEIVERRWTHISRDEKRNLQKAFATHENGLIIAGFEDNISTDARYRTPEGGSQRGMLSLSRGGRFLFWTPLRDPNDTRTSNGSLCHMIRMSDVNGLNLRKRPQYETLGMAELVVVIGGDVGYEYECCVKDLPLGQQEEWYDEMFEAILVAWFCWRRNHL